MFPIFPDFQFRDLRKINKKNFCSVGHRSLIKNKTQPAVINIVSFRIFKFIKMRIPQCLAALFVFYFW